MVYVGIDVASHSEAEDADTQVGAGDATAQPSLGDMETQANDTTVVT